MLPVCGKVPPPGLGIGTACALNDEISAVIAEATAGTPRTARPSRARHVDGLRISINLSLPVDGQLRLDPGSSGAMPVRRYRDLRPAPENNGEFLGATISVVGFARK